MFDLKSFPEFQGKDVATTLREASMNTAIHKPMTESLHSAINFDRVKDAYNQKVNCLDTPKSNDALLQEGGTLYFLEFKDGDVEKEKHEIGRKIYDSLLILTDIIGRGISYTRENMVYILIYNGDALYSRRPGLKGIIENVAKGAKRQPDFFEGLRKRFVPFCFKELRCCEKRDFTGEF